MLVASSAERRRTLRNSPPDAFGAATFLFMELRFARTAGQRKTRPPSMIGAWPVM
jgi:hypothetical protein